MVDYKKTKARYDLAKQRSFDHAKAVILNTVMLRLFGTFVGLVVILVNGFSALIAGPVLVVAAASDLFRYLRRDAPPTSNAFLKAVTGNVFSISALAVIAIAYCTGWFFAADWCWPVLNSFIEANAWLPARALEPIGPACEVPRGSYQLFTQATLPLFIFAFLLYGSIVLANSARYQKLIRSRINNVRINTGLSEVFVVSVMLLFLYTAPLFTIFHGDEGRFGAMLPNLKITMYIFEVLVIYLISFMTACYLVFWRLTTVDYLHKEEISEGDWK